MPVMGWRPDWARALRVARLTVAGWAMLAVLGILNLFRDWGQESTVGTIWIASTSVMGWLGFAAACRLYRKERDRASRT